MESTEWIKILHILMAVIVNFRCRSSCRLSALSPPSSVNHRSMLCRWNFVSICSRRWWIMAFGLSGDVTNNFQCGYFGSPIRCSSISFNSRDFHWRAKKMLELTLPLRIAIILLLTHGPKMTKVCLHWLLVNAAQTNKQEIHFIYDRRF